MNAGLRRTKEGDAAPCERARDQKHHDREQQSEGAGEGGPAARLGVRAARVQHARLEVGFKFKHARLELSSQYH